MTAEAFPRLDLRPASDGLDLLGEPVATAVGELVALGLAPPSGIRVAPIDPGASDTASTVDLYGVPPERAANCVIVSGRRQGEERVAALVVLASTRADVNGVVKRLLDVRKCSFLDREAAVSRTGMEFGGICPLGLPDGWRILVDRRVVEAGPVVIGSGIRASKVVVDGAVLGRLPGAEVFDDLAVPII